MASQLIDLEYCADSVEIVDIPDYDHLVVCGTYQLSEEQGCRLGRAYFYNITEGILVEQARKEYDGILDMKWANISDSHYLAIATSTGKIHLEKFATKETVVESVETFQAANENVLSLSLDWSTKLATPGRAPQIAVSFSDGSISLIDVKPDGLQTVHNWKAHDFEVWITAFNCFDTSIVYSGGDDCRLSGWDTRSFTRVFNIRNKNAMGYTSIQHSHFNEFQLATGSYDEHLMIWDTRAMKTPVSDIHVGGGVWRIKWHPHKPSLLTTASMHNGFHVIDTETSAIVSHNTFKASLGYGTDWVPNMEDTLVSCSFYDKALQLWKC